MRKKEFIHVHALLLEISEYVMENEDVDQSIHPRYDTLEVCPSSVHKPKRTHYEAVTILGDSIERTLEQARTESPDCPVSRPQ